MSFVFLTFLKRYLMSVVSGNLFRNSSLLTPIGTSNPKFDVLKDQQFVMITFVVLSALDQKL
jgi:hypothetical protein